MTHGPSTGAATGTGLDRLIAAPRLKETNGVDLALAPDRAWELVRHANLGHSPVVRALFSLRTLPARVLRRDVEPLMLTLDDLVSSPDRPGFQILLENPPREVVVGAIGKVWRPAILFVHVPTAQAFAAFDRPGFVKVAWVLRLAPLGAHATRVTVELRATATDETSWRKFRRYFSLVGTPSGFIRRSLLAGLAHAYGTPESAEPQEPLPGDDLIPDADVQLTHGVTVRARPEDVWPWLVQMGCRRAGFYSIDALDNGGRRSAREIHPELQDIRVGDVLPATPGGDDGFEVLRVEPAQAFVLGGLHDVRAHRQLAFATARPPRFRQVTWAFALRPRGDGTTRLLVRARAASPTSGRLYLAGIRMAHQIMQTAQLRHLAARVEGRVPRDDYRDVLDGVRGAAVMTAGFLTPFLRTSRGRWGLGAGTAHRRYVGDDLVPEPRWGWTHGIEIEAPAEDVWPWVAQIGADRGGFYSYQWLENLLGCQVRNAETVRPGQAVRQGGRLLLHPKVPPLQVVRVVPGRCFVAAAVPPFTQRAPGARWVAVSWLFDVEPLGPGRCRFISRYRCATSEDPGTRWRFGPALVEPIGFAMDRRMLHGVKERAERSVTGVHRPRSVPLRTAVRCTLIPPRGS